MTNEQAVNELRPKFGDGTPFPECWAALTPDQKRQLITAHKTAPAPVIKQRKRKLPLGKAVRRIYWR